jgi:outer membrane protein assembly factor BamB
VAACCAGLLSACTAGPAGAVHHRDEAGPLAQVQLWTSRFGGPGADYALAIAVSPGGRKVFVTGRMGRSPATNEYLDYATVAYDAATGQRLWVSRYQGFRLDNVPSAVAVSPDGSTVYVTGTSQYSGELGIGNDYATVAYSATTGAQLWVSRYNGPANGDHVAMAVAVSPDGGTVFVTGWGHQTASGWDYATIAYDAHTGQQLWLKQYNGSANKDSTASALAVSPDGRMVFVTGTSIEVKSGFDYATVAYDARTGAERWISTYNGGANFSNSATSLRVSPDGGTVFVTGESGIDPYGYDFATVAYDAATGAQRWVSRYNGPGDAIDVARSVAVSPDGRAVYVTGRSDGGPRQPDYATIAYNARTGAQEWVRRYNGHGNCRTIASSVAVGAGGREIFVTGASTPITSLPSSCDAGIATIAYSAAGTQLWLKRVRNGALYGGLAISRATNTVFVAGSILAGPSSGFDYDTVAYHG